METGNGRKGKGQKDGIDRKEGEWKGRRKMKDRDEGNGRRGNEGRKD